MKLPLAKNQKGYALVFAVMILLVLSILGTAMLSVLAGNLSTSTEEREFQSAYYTAEAGAVYHMKVIKKEILNLYLTVSNSLEFFNEIESFRLEYPKDMDNFELEYGSQPRAEVLFERIDALGSNPCTYRLTSKGSLDDCSRTVTKVFQIQWVSGFMSVFAKGQIKLDNGIILGPIGTNSTNSDAILITGNPYIQDVNLLSEAGMVTPYGDWLKNWDLLYNRLTLSSPKLYEMPVFPPFPVYGIMPDVDLGGFKVINAGSVLITNYKAEGYILNLPGNVYIPKIEIKSNWNLYINVGNTDKAIVVDDIILNSGHIHLIGSGKLTIYLKNNVTLSGGSGINRPADESNAAQVIKNVEKLFIYMKSSGIPPKTIAMTGSQKIYGSLYAEDANISIANGSGFQGSIVTGGKSVTISGGTSVTTSLLFAPNAAVTLSNGGMVYGPIISDTFTMSGGTTIKYNPKEGIVYNPFNVEVGISLFDLLPMDGAIREK